VERKGKKNENDYGKTNSGNKIEDMPPKNAIHISWDAYSYEDFKKEGKFHK
jgi:hypothetical protein